MFQEFPKWVYLTDGPQESYAEGTAPVLVNNAEQEKALKPEPVDKFEPTKRPGRPPSNRG